MIPYCEKPTEVAKRLQSDVNRGLTDAQAKENLIKYGANVLSKTKGQTLFKRIIKALFEPMMLILLFGLVVTLGINVGKAASGAGGSFYECIGIAAAIFISVTLTVVMEGKSQKAFEYLSAAGDKTVVKIIRDGKPVYMDKTALVVGDLVECQAGDAICADGRIISAVDLKTDESALTGESAAVEKTCAVLPASALLAERKNMVYSGTFVESGTVRYMVTAVGRDAEIGKVADMVGSDKTLSAPLKEKLDRLGKFVSIFGLLCAFFVFVLSVVRLILSDEASIISVEEVFIKSIVLIVAAVPEGLPATVAISLTLNVVRLSKENALIKKLVATETIGSVSVICTDKTGTLTQNRMLVERLVTPRGDMDETNFSDRLICLNAAINSTAEADGETVRGSKTEGALLFAMRKSGVDYLALRSSAVVIAVKPFSSADKYMSTTVTAAGGNVTYVKGAPEVVLSMCDMPTFEKKRLLSDIEAGQRRGSRALAFAHTAGDKTVFDGYALIGDKLREGVKASVKRCLAAGVKVKILTGDGPATAAAIAAECGLDTGKNAVVTADVIENATDDELGRILNGVTVIARSTPKTKLKVVTALQRAGEVVAVTGDGVNDAPAIKHADVGIAMGGGSGITKEASDVVLLDDRFETILSAISFGRNVFDNFQRFISFQLTVNLASIAIIITYLVLGLEAPFSSTCLLWLNVIMDGPLALSLGTESRPPALEKSKPVKRDSDILSKKMLARIAVHAFFICFIVTMQELFNFLRVAPTEKPTVTITLFVFFQLFNAINCREVRLKSALSGVFDNKLLSVMLMVTFFTHILITTLMPDFFGTVRLSFSLWIKLTLVCSSVVAFSETYKWVLRGFSRRGVKITKFGIMKRRKVA